MVYPEERFYPVSAGQIAELNVALTVLNQVTTIRETSPEMINAGVADIVDLSRSMMAQVLGELVAHGDQLADNPLVTEIQSSMRNLAERIDGWSR